MKPERTEALGAAACSALRERHGKRRNITRWRESRYRRLEYEVRQGRASARQIARLEQLRPNSGLSDK